MLNSREKIPFAVSHEARHTYVETVIPFWQGKSVRDLIFREMKDEWKDAYDAGIFTEFMEQRSPGHTVLVRLRWTEHRRAAGHAHDGTVAG